MNRGGPLEQLPCQGWNSGYHAHWSLFQPSADPSFESRSSRDSLKAELQRLTPIP